MADLSQRRSRRRGRSLDAQGSSQSDPVPEDATTAQAVITGRLWFRLSPTTNQWDTSRTYALGMDGDDLRPVRPFRTPWTVGRLVADTCVWIAWREPENPEQPAIVKLLRYRREGRVEISKTDTVDTERADGVSAATATDRILETAGIIELHGPTVICHSRWDHAVFASDEDSDRIDNLLGLLFPNSDRYATDRSSTHNLRDAMHIATAIRYGYDAFVTTDT